LSEYNSGDRKIILGGLNELDWIEVSDEKKVATYRVLQELMVNMRKHSGATIVVIRFESAGNQIRISYTDNGSGMATGRVSFKNGLANVENRINAINGTITFESGTEKGLKILITYKVKK